jgi:hypothetical protein
MMEKKQKIRVRLKKILNVIISLCKLGVIEHICNPNIGRLQQEDVKLKTILATKLVSKTNKQ